MLEGYENLQPTDLERQQALDKALSSFSTPTVISGQKVNTIKGIPGAGYTDNPTVVDEEELTGDENVIRLDDQGEPIQEETEADEPDTTESDEGYSEGFATEFKKAFGLEPAEAIDTFNQLLNFRNEIVLMQEWDVTPGEYRNRMSQVKEFYDGLPAEGKDQFNTPEGAIAIWNHLHPTGKQKVTGSVKTTRKTTKVNSEPKYLFNKSQILAMSPDEFRQNAAAIQQAYLNNRVNENK